MKHADMHICVWNAASWLKQTLKMAGRAGCLGHSQPAQIWLQGAGAAQAAAHRTPQRTQRALSKASEGQVRCAISCECRRHLRKCNTGMPRQPSASRTPACAIDVSQGINQIRLISQVATCCHRQTSGEKRIQSAQAAPRPNARIRQTCDSNRMRDATPAEQACGKAGPLVSCTAKPDTGVAHLVPSWPGQRLRSHYAAAHLPY